MTSTLIHIVSAPTPEPEPLELAMALAAFDLPVTLLFSGAGVLWLKQDLKALFEGGKAPSRIIKALPMYDCEELYACEASLARFGLQENKPAFVAPVSAEAARGLVVASQHCLRF